MAIELTDDGTLDTVLRCSDCGEEFRFNYDPASDGYPIEDAAEDAYDDFVQECIEAAESEHNCGDEDEPEDGDPTEPGEDDITTTDHRTFYQYGKRVLEQDENGRTWSYRADIRTYYTLGEFGDDHRAALRAYMERTQFWSNCWFVSDHGNAHLMDVTEDTK